MMINLRRNYLLLFMLDVAVGVQQKNVATNVAFAVPTGIGFITQSDSLRYQSSASIRYVAQSDTPGHRSRRSLLQARGGPFELDENDKLFQIPSDGLPLNDMFLNRPKPEISSNTNTTIPIAMMVLQTERFPSISKALRTIRKRQIWFSSLGDDQNWKQGKAGTRVQPGDSIVYRKPTFSTTTSYQGLTYRKSVEPIPVVYQDNHMAIVFKPSGMITYSNSKGGYNHNSVLRELPHVLTPPLSFENAYRWPVTIHRLDLGTSGLLVVAKTKPASTHLGNQFMDRGVEKVYTAILNGIPSFAKNIIDCPVDGKEAITEWKELSRFRSMNAINATCTIVQFRPQHGRTHQLRKHAADVLGCPIVGDDLYGPSKMLQPKGKFFLCASGITLEHPVFDGKENSAAKHSEKQSVLEKYPQFLAEQKDGTLRLHVEVDVPERWKSFIKIEEKKMRNYEKWMMKEGIRCILDIHAMVESQRKARAPS